MSALAATAAAPLAAKGAATADATGFAALLGDAGASVPAAAGAAPAAIVGDAGVSGTVVTPAGDVPVAVAAAETDSTEVPVAQGVPVSTSDPETPRGPDRSGEDAMATLISSVVPARETPAAVSTPTSAEPAAPAAVPAFAAVSATIVPIAPASTPGRAGQATPAKSTARAAREDEAAPVRKRVVRDATPVAVAPVPVATIVPTLAGDADPAPARTASAAPVPLSAPAAAPDLADAAPVMAALTALPGLAAPAVSARVPAADPVATGTVAETVAPVATSDLLAARTAAMAPAKPVDPPVVAAAVMAPVAKADPAAAKPKRGERRAEAAPAADIAASAPADTVPTAAAPATPVAAAAPDAPARPVAAGTQLAAAATDRHVAVAKHAAWADGIARDIAAAGAATGTARFTVAPETLGPVQVAVTRGEDGQADVTLTASNVVAQTALTEARPQLIAEARAQGLHIREALVDLGSSGSGNPSENRHAHAAQPVAVPEQRVTANAPSTISLTDTGYGGGVGGDAGRQAQQQAQSRQPVPQATVRVPQAPAPAETPVRERADDGRYA